MEKSYIILYEGDIEQRFIENGIEQYMILNDRLSIIYTDENFDTSILDNTIEVSDWHESRVMSSLIQIGEGLENGETVESASGLDYITNNPYISVNGEGVLIGIIDSGIDYLHPDFINEDGTSKIISIWDQEGESNPPPSGLLFGSEFSQEDINRAISENNSNLTTDEVGTGTIAAGIAAGKGRLNPLYRGVADNSKLVVVKLKHYEDTFKEGRINYLNTDFLAAIKYVCDISEREGMMTIINLTIGENSRSVILTTLLDTFDYLYNPGVVLVSGAGNEGNTNIHYEGNFTQSTSYQDVIMEVGEQKSLEVNIAANGPGQLAISLISPSGEVSEQIRYSPEDPIYRGRFNIEGSDYSVKIFYPWLLSGNEEIDIKIDDIKPGIWTIRIFPEFITNGQLDIYLPNKNLISEETQFLDPESFATITLYGSTENVITIGAFNDKINSLWIGSSKGPIRNKIAIKPDIVAPGVDIISTYVNQSYIKSTGTGVSSSLTCGVLALIMQYIFLQGDYIRNSLYTRVLKTYLMLGATKSSIYTYPNDSEGFGILNLQNTIEAIANKL